jgi:hypothetical protein
VTCPQCTTEHRVHVWTLVDSSDQETTNELLAQHVNVFACPHCNCMALLDVSLTYLDRGLGYGVHYLCKRDMERDGFYANMSKQGRFILHPAKGTDGELTEIHIVFSMRELVTYIHFRSRCAELGA